MTKFIIHIHDFAGHPFQAELSNELSKSGHSVIHSYFVHPGVSKGVLRDIHHTNQISFVPISFKQQYENRKLIKRFFFEIHLLFSLLRIHMQERPDISVFANTPLLTAALFRFMTLNSLFVLWHQDIFSHAIRLLLQSQKRDLGFLKEFLVSVVTWLEGWLVRRSNWVICISESFLIPYTGWNKNLDKVTVIENWAPLGLITQQENSTLITNSPKFIYAGTLGLKHNPQLLIQLIQGLRNSGLNPSLLVISQGEGADFLRYSENSDPSIVVMDFLPIDVLNKEFQQANFALMLLEETASLFSVPSKTYSYLSAGKFVVGFAPLENAASQALLEAGSLVFRPSEAGIVDAISEISKITEKRLHAVENQSRAFANKQFNIRDKEQAFNKIFQQVSKGLE